MEKYERIFIPLYKMWNKNSFSRRIILLDNKFYKIGTQFFLLGRKNGLDSSIHTHTNHLRHQCHHKKIELFFLYSSCTICAETTLFKIETEEEWSVSVTVVPKMSIIKKNEQTKSRRRRTRKTLLN